MKIIVTHTSPDWDAIGSVWILRRFLPGWDEAKVEYVPAGQRYKNLESKIQNSESGDVIEKINDDEVIHVDTGMGPLDHHQVSDQSVCAASRCWDYVQQVQNSKFKIQNDDRIRGQQEAISRIIKVIVEIDHFRECFWDNPTADYQEFSLIGILDGLKYMKPDQDEVYTSFGMQCLDALVHAFENRIAAEKEIAANGVPFETKWGKGIGYETINDTVVKLSQKMGYIVVVRKDPRKGYARIKVRPATGKADDLDLTLAYEKLKKIDPEATWFLHVSKKMLLNGTPKNPKMIPTKLTLKQLISVLEAL